MGASIGMEKWKQASRLNPTLVVFLLTLFSLLSSMQAVYAKEPEATVLLLGVDGKPLPGVKFNYATYFDETRYEKLSGTSDSNGLARVRMLGPRAELYGFEDGLLSDISPDGGVVVINSVMPPPGRAVEPSVIKLPAIRTLLNIVDRDIGMHPPTVALLKDTWVRAFFSPFDGSLLLTIMEGSSIGIASPFRRTAKITLTAETATTTIYLEKTARLAMKETDGSLVAKLNWEGLEDRDVEATFLVRVQMINSEGRKNVVELGFLGSLEAKGEKQWSFEVPSGFEKSLINLQILAANPWSLLGDKRTPVLALEGYTLIYPGERDVPKNLTSELASNQLLLYSLGAIALLVVGAAVYLALSTKLAKRTASTT